MPARRLALILIVLGALLIVLLVFSDLVPYLRGPAPETSEWYWPYLLRPASRWLPTILVGAGILLLFYRWLGRAPDNRRANRLAVLGLVVGSLLLQLTLIYAERPQVEAELIDRVLSVRTSGHFWTAAGIPDLGGVLRNFPQEMAGFESEHSRTHPPGLLMANWATIALLAKVPSLAEPIAEQVWPHRCTDLWLLKQPAHVAAALAIWAVLPLLAAALAVLPAYLLARELFDHDAARLSALGVATMPAVLLFATQSDQLFVLLSLLLVNVFHLALSRDRLFLFLLAGLLLSLSSFMTMGNAALLLPLLLYAGFEIWQGKVTNRQLKRWLYGALAFAAGGAALWLVFWAGWGVEPWEIALAGIGQHYELVASRRNYAWWLLFNLVDLLTYVGVIWLTGFFWLIWRTVRHGRRQAAGLLAIAIAIFMLLLDVSGSTRGEVGRLWLFFTPLIALLGAGFLAHAYPEKAVRLLLVALQLLLAAAIGFSWRPIEAVIVVAQEPEMPELPEAMQPVGVRFGDDVVLQGFDVAVSAAASELEITLIWSTSERITRPYTVFNHLLNSEGEIVAQHDGWPVANQWPPNCWASNEAIVDRHIISLPDNLMPGVYRLVSGLYDATTGDRLTTSSGDDFYLLDEMLLGD